MALNQDQRKQLTDLYASTLLSSIPEAVDAVLRPPHLRDDAERFLQRLESEPATPPRRGRSAMHRRRG